MPHHRNTSGHKQGQNGSFTIKGFILVTYSSIFTSANAGACARFFSYKNQASFEVIGVMLLVMLMLVIPIGAQRGMTVIMVQFQ